MTIVSKSLLDFIVVSISQTLERQLQTVTILQWTLLIFLGGFIGLFTCIYLLFTPYFALVIFYIAWICYDRNTCKKGGRRSEWVRQLTIWKYYRDYFPIRLIKTAELNKSRNYIFGCHPHGVLSIGAYCNFCTEANDFSQLFPGIVPHLVTLCSYFRFPLVREYFAWTGACCSSPESFKYILTEKGKGNAVVVVVGGVAEALESKPNQFVLNLKKRKGFVKLAISCGADLVPVISFGENDTFKLKNANDRQKTWLSQLKRKLYMIMGLCPPLFYYFCFWRAKTYGLMPDRKPIITVVGQPIEVVHQSEPSQEAIEHYHTLYTQRLEQLFNEYKEKLGNKYNNLIFTLQ